MLNGDGGLGGTICQGITESPVSLYAAAAEGVVAVPHLDLCDGTAAGAGEHEGRKLRVLIVWGSLSCVGLILKRGKAGG